MINATQIRKGMIIKMDSSLYRVLETVHITPGRWKAIIQTRLRNMKDGTLLDHRFRSMDRVEQAFLEEPEMEFLYREGEDYIFMNLENYDQLKLSAETIGDAAKYLIPNIVITVEMHDGKPVGVSLPTTVDLTVVRTEPTLVGATKSASAKPAVLENGLTIAVPQFIKEGDVIRIDTRDDEYLERVKIK
jgi:elongation factor P